MGGRGLFGCSVGYRDVGQPEGNISISVAVGQAESASCCASGCVLGYVTCAYTGGRHGGTILYVVHADSQEGPGVDGDASVHDPVAGAVRLLHVGLVDDIAVDRDGAKDGRVEFREVFTAENPEGVELKCPECHDRRRMWTGKVVRRPCVLK